MEWVVLAAWRGGPQAWLNQSKMTTCFRHLGTGAGWGDGISAPGGHPDLLNQLSFTKGRIKTGKRGKEGPALEICRVVSTEVF